MKPIQLSIGKDTLYMKSIQMLTHKMEKYVTGNGRGYKTGTQRQYKARIIKYSQKAIEDLTLIAANMDENTLAKIFNSHELSPLFQSVFKLDCRAKDSEQTRTRLLQLCWDLLSYLGYTEHASKLAPKAWAVLRYSPHSNIPTLKGIEAILIESLNPYSS